MKEAFIYFKSTDELISSLLLYKCNIIFHVDIFYGKCFWLFVLVRMFFNLPPLIIYVSKKNISIKQWWALSEFFNHLK